METRELRYFVAVAEELHFGRAAQRLAMSQPPLSRAIQQLERRLGVTLVHRSSRTISLTAAGEVLLHEARTALEAVEAAQRRTRRAANKQTPGLVLATKAGASSELVAKILRACASAPTACEVDVVLCRPGEQGLLLRDGRADAALFQRPYDCVSGFDTEELRTEQQVLVLPADHPLAARTHLTMAEVKAQIELPFPRWPQPDGSYRPGSGPHVRDHTQLFQLIALGRACALVPASVRPHLGPNLAHVTVPDAPAVTTVIAWPPHIRSRAVADLVRTAAQCAME